MAKEFVSVMASEKLSDNYSRILKDTTEATQLSYHKRFKGWCITSAEELSEFIDELNAKWIAGEYRYATIRQYKATIGYALSNAYQFKVNDIDTLNFKFKEYFILAKNSSKEDLESLYQEYLSIGTEGDIPEIDKKAQYNGNTSSIKDKRFPDELLNRILQLKKPESIGFLQDFLRINIKLGLRPIEYKDCTLLRHDIAHNKSLLEGLGFSNTSSENALSLVVREPDSTKPLLLVKNAKNSHSRACGDFRLLYLDVLDEEEIETLRKMMLKMKEIKKNSKENFKQAVLEPLRRQLYYILTTDPVCKKIITNQHQEKMRQYRFQSKYKNRNEPVFKRPTLYSTRHQAVANAKAKELHPVEIAACFGHSSVFTAENHYGKRIFGSGGNSLSPAQVSVNEVVARLDNDNAAPRLETRIKFEGMQSIKEPQKATQPKPSKANTNTNTNSIR